MAKKKVAGITIELDADTSQLVKGLDAAAKKVGDVGKAIEKTGENLTKYITGPIVAIGGASIKAFTEVDEGLDTIKQKTGATGEEAEAMGQIMENLATSIPTDFATAGEAIGEVSTRFGVTGDELETLSGQFLKFAQLQDTDVTTSIDTVQKALSAYGLGAEDAAAYLDRLNKVGQETGVSVDSLSNGIISNATAFQEMGLNIDEAVTFMGQLDKSGVNSETVLNGMRKALKNATKEGKPLDQALIELQNTILNGTGSMDGLTAAYDIFGKSGDQIYGAIKQGTVNFADLATAMTDAGGSISDTFEATLDPTDQFKTTMNELKVVGADVGGTILELLLPVLQQVKDIITRVKEAWEGLSPETQEMIVKAAGIAAAVGPVLVVIGKVVGAVSSVISIASSLSAVLGALAGPVGIVIAVIAALVAIGILLYKNWDTIKEKATEVCDWVKEKWENIKNAVSEAWNTVKEKTSEAFNSIKDKIENSAIGQATAKVWDAMKKTATDAFDNIKKAYDEHGGGLKGAAYAAIEGVKQYYTAGFNFLDNLTGGKLTEIKNKVTEIFTKIKDTITGTVDKIKTSVSNTFDSIKQIFQNAIDFVKRLFSGEISFPHIKIPHFHISGGEMPWGIGGMGTKPQISVEWYKKAMSKPFLLDGATIFGAMGGKLLGGGESGAEMVVGVNKLMQMISQASGAGQTVISNTFNIDAADKDPQELAQEISFYLDMELQRTEKVFA